MSFKSILCDDKDYQVSILIKCFCNSISSNICDILGYILKNGYFTLYLTRVLREFTHAISRNSSLRGIAYTKNTNQNIFRFFRNGNEYTNENNLVYDDIYKTTTDKFYLHPNNFSMQWHRSFIICFNGVCIL